MPIPILEMLPCVTIIHDAQDGSVVHMSSQGCTQLGISLAEIQALGTGYHARFFNAEQSSEYVAGSVEDDYREQCGQCFYLLSAGSD